MLLPIRRVRRFATSAVDKGPRPQNGGTQRPAPAPRPIAHLFTHARPTLAGIPSFALPMNPRLFLLPLLMAAVTACSRDDVPPPPPGAALLEDPALSELSGLEASPRDAGVLWGINDSGSFPRLYRFDTRGRALGRVSVHGAFIRDSESLAVWQEQPGGQAWMLIGDVGDNRGWRDEVRVHAVAEPALSATRARIAWTLRFRYPDGPRDAEGIAVDHRDRQLLVLSKRDRPARLYGVPLDGAPQPTTAHLIAELPAGVVDGDATGLDVSRDGRQLAVLSYRGLYLWTREPGVSWGEALLGAPRELTLPRLRKAEALTFDHASRAIFVGSEKRPSPLVRVLL
jgi:hypothetical protein